MCFQHCQGTNTHQDDRPGNRNGETRRYLHAFKRNVSANNNDLDAVSADERFPETIKWQSEQWRHSGAQPVTRKRTRVSAGVHAMVEAPRNLLRNIMRSQNVMRREQYIQPSKLQRPQGRTTKQKLDVMGLRGFRRS